MCFQEGDRVRVRKDGPTAVSGVAGKHAQVVYVTPQEDYRYTIKTDDGLWDAVNDEDLEPVSASLSACERVLWASTQEYIRAANTEAETKREGYLSAFRQVVEEDRPELAGKQWTVENGVFVVQQ